MYISTAVPPKLKAGSENKSWQSHEVLYSIISACTVSFSCIQALESVAQLSNVHIGKTWFCYMPINHLVILFYCMTVFLSVQTWLRAHYMNWWSACNLLTSVRILLLVLISENQHFSISFQNWDWGHLDKNKRRFGEHSKFGCNPSITQWLQHLPRGQSSPGNRQSGQHPSNGRRQIPHSVSSFATHLQIATAVQLLILTFMAMLLVDTTEFCF